MSIILNNTPGVAGFDDALSQLGHGAHSLSIGVSYVQLGGWELLRRRLAAVLPANIRMVCTDQMNITQPAALSYAIAEGAQVKNFNRSNTYHTKVFIAHDVDGRPINFLIGSANLSYSAFSTSVEAGMLGSDPADLHALSIWFNDLFHNQSELITPHRLGEMEAKWRVAAARRTQSRLHVRRGIVVPAGVQIPIEAEDLDTLEDVFATIQLPIGLLNFDYAANTVRSVRLARQLLSDWSRLRTAKGNTAVKHRSELRLLGLADGANLTQLGFLALQATSDEALARLWCEWLQLTDNHQLERINPRLVIAKRIFPRFWRLQPEVREYFLSHAEKQSKTERRLLKTIEILCNAGDVIENLSLDDVRTLESMLNDHTNELPPNIKKAIDVYASDKVGKGYRGWSSHDRRIVPTAWREVNASHN